MKRKPEISLDKYKCADCHNLFYLTTKELGHDGPCCGNCSMFGVQLPPQTGRFKIVVKEKLSDDNNPVEIFAIYKKIFFVWMKIYSSSTKTRDEMKLIFANIVMKHYHNKEAVITEKLDLYDSYTKIHNDLKTNKDNLEGEKKEVQTVMERFKGFALDQKGDSFSTPEKINIGNSIIDCMEL